MSEVLAQYFEVYIAGYKLSDAWLELLQEVVYEDSSTGSDLLTLTFTDPDLEILNSKRLFLEEQAVKFVGGYVNHFRTMFEGYISVIDIDFPEDGTPVVIVHCMDNTHLMNREKKSRTWQNKKVSDVAREIFKSYGLVPIIDDTIFVEESISQSDETDIEFLTKQTEDLDDPFICYVEGNKGYLVRKNLIATPQDTITYRDKEFKLISFSPRITKEDKKEQVTKSNVNAKDGKVDTGLATESIARDISGEPVKTTSNKSVANGGNKATKSSSSSSNSDSGTGITHTYLGNGQWT